MRVGYRKRTTAGDKTICLPLPEQVVYDEWIEDSVGYRQYLDEQIAQHPELFPPEITQGYCLDGFVLSKRQQMKTRRILLKANRQVYQIRPDTVLPYMIGKTEEVEKGLYLRRYGMPFIRRLARFGCAIGTTLFPSLIIRWIFAGPFTLPMPLSP